MGLFEVDFLMVMVNKKTWVESISETVPDYAEDIATRLTEFMKPNKFISQDVLHGCALAAASATSNGGLVFEISMNGLLFGSNEREIAKKAAVLVSLEHLRHSAALGVGSRVGRISDPKDTNYSLYAYAAAVALGSEYLVRYYASELDDKHIKIEGRNLIAEIASTIAAVGKIT